MPVRQLDRIKAGDRDVVEIQNNVVEFMKQIYSFPMFDGSAVDNIQFGAAPSNVSVYHRLGRLPTGWIITDISGDYPNVFRASWDASSITLTGSAGGGGTTTISIWVY